MDTWTPDEWAEIIAEYYRPCRACGRLFDPWPRAVRYCSDTCRPARAMRQATRYRQWRGRIYGPGNEAAPAGG